MKFDRPSSLKKKTTKRIKPISVNIGGKLHTITRRMLFSVLRASIRKFGESGTFLFFIESLRLEGRNFVANQLAGCTKEAEECDLLVWDT